MTKTYVQQIKLQQAQGPYYLGGWSMGGVIAYAAAQYLIENGDTVSALWLLDSPIPKTRETPNGNDLLRWFISDVTQRDVLPHIESLENDHPIFSDVISELQILGLIDSGIGNEFESIFACFCANIKLLHHYAAKPLAAKTSVLLAMANQYVEARVSHASSTYWLELLEESNIQHLQLNTNHYGIIGSDSLKKIIPKIEEILMEEYAL